jgi:hypothetical protein
MAPLKRSCPTPPLPSLLPRALPVAVWGDHLLPMLAWGDAARLERTCKALKTVVRENYTNASCARRMISLRGLSVVLTTFPRVRTLALAGWDENWDHTSEDTLIRWLREEGRGRYLTGVSLSDGVTADFVHAALREGALPSLKSLKSVDFSHGNARALLMEGLIGATDELSLEFVSTDNGICMKRQLAALGLVRQLPALAKLEVFVSGDNGDAVQWPPFIPRPLKELHLDVTADRDLEQSLLLVLPGMLEASGAGLERLEIDIASDVMDVDNCLVPVAQALRCCAPTLRGFQLALGHDTIYFGNDGNIVERMRVLWADVLAGVSTCRELQVLVLPCIGVEPLFPSGAAFARLTNLELSDCGRERPSDVGAMGLWELMASGRLPALAKLIVYFERPGGGSEDVKTRMAPAFEAVAGTLTHLQLDKRCAGEWLSDGVDGGYELGVAVGKLRRLKDLILDLSEDGRFYHVMAQGLASGGGRPLPLLWRLSVPFKVRVNGEQVVSLLLPSVQMFVFSHYLDRQAALLMACSLRQVGYTHSWAVGLPCGVENAVRAIVQCKLVDRDVHLRFWNEVRLPLD